MSHLVPSDHRRNTTDTTRLLAAGTYLDPDYRRSVLDSTVRDPARFVCPSFGVDIGTVVRHALVAHRRGVVRDLVLLLDAVALLVVAWHAVRLSGERVYIGGSVVTVPADRTRSLVALLVLLGVALAVTAADAWVRLDTLWRHFVPGRDVPPGPMPRDARAARQIATFDQLARANVVVFASRAPFVGSGARVDGGTAAINLQGRLGDPDEADRGRHQERPRRRPVPFDERDLLDRLSAALRTLELPGLQVHERVYVNGMDTVTALDGRLLRGPERPASWVEDHEVKAVLADPMGAARHYLCAETTSWHGHLVSTTFTRVVKLPELLYVESSAYALPPLSEKMLAVDSLPLLDPAGRLLKALGEGIVQFLPALVRSPATVLRAVLDATTADRRLAVYQAAVRDGLLVDQGAVTSVRQAAAGSRLGTYYLEQDMVMHNKAVATRLAEELQEFLAEYGYDIGELNFQQDVSFTTVQNNGGYIGSIGKGSTGSVDAGTQPAAPSSSPAPAARS